MAEKSADRAYRKPSNIVDAALNVLNLHPNAAKDRVTKGKNAEIITSLVKRALREQAYKQYINVIQFDGLPWGYTSQDIGRMQLLRGNVAFSFDKNSADEDWKDIKDFNPKRYNILPYVLKNVDKTQSPIDEDGTFKWICPVPFLGPIEENKKFSRLKYLDDQPKRVIKDIPFVSNKEQAQEIIKNGAVILYERTPFLAETNLPFPVTEINAFIDLRIEGLQLARKSAFNSVAPTWLAMQKSDADSFNNLMDDLDEFILYGPKYLAISSATEVFEGALPQGSVAGIEQLAYSDAWKNLMDSCIGIDNQGPVQKRAQMLNAELALENMPTKFPLLDRWYNAIQWCNIVNAIWGLEMTCLPAEWALQLLLGNDKNENKESKQEGEEVVDEQ